MLRYRLRMFLASWWFASVAAWFTGHRRRIRSNLKRIHPDWTPRKRYNAERRIANNIGRTYAEFVFIRGFHARVAESSELKGPGVAAMKKAQADGRSCIFATAHFANYLACVRALTENGIPAGILYRQIGTRALDYLFDRVMNSFDQKLFKIGRRQDRSYQRNLYNLARHVKGGGHVGLLLDQRVDSGAQLRFFGQPAWTALSIAEMAIKFNAVLIPSYALRQPDGVHFRFYLQEPIANTEPVGMMQEFNDRAEAWIRAHPEQWFWNIRRWD
ncbi:MAG: lysophospholipid acyltransferase family protein [Pseudomonadota bacterium]